METKLLICKMENLKFTLVFLDCLVVNCEGCSVGIVLFWHQDVNMEIVSYSKQHIEAWVSDLNLNCKWHMTTVYGHLKVGHRKGIWQLLKSTSVSPIGPWICFWNFNRVVSNSEWQMRDFRDAIDSCNF